MNDLNKTLTAALEKEKRERQQLIAAGPQVVAPVVPPSAKGVKELEATLKAEQKRTKEQAEQSE